MSSIPKKSIIPIFVPNLGCPHKCVFCNQRKITGEDRPITPETVKREVEKALSVLPLNTEKQVAFYGGSFTAIPKESYTGLLSAVKEYIDSGRISSVRLSTRPDAIDDEVLNCLRDYGVKVIELGAQSLVDEVLAAAGRGHTAQDVINASKKIKKSGFDLVLQMMTGLPGDSDENDISTAEKIVQLRPDAVRIYPTVIVKDTDLYYLWRNGRYKEHTVENAVEICAKLVSIFEKACIKIIRIGLNPTDELTCIESAGGAYHPALGEMVRSRVLRNKAEEILRSSVFSNKIEIRVNPAQLSQMIGQRKSNIDFLKNRYGMLSVELSSDDEVEKGSINIFNI